MTRSARWGRALAVFAIAAAAVPAVGQQAAAGPWSIEVAGARRVVLPAAELERLLGARRAEMVLNVKGADRVYAGYPLWSIAALADDPADVTGASFDRKRWEAGYDITITAGDGYAATLNTKGLALEAVLLADREGGQPIVPTIVGSIDRSLWVKGVASIELAIEGAQAPGAASSGTAPAGQGAVAPAAPDFGLVLDLNGVVRTFSIAELEASPLYVEAPGSYTTSVGSTYTGRYGGVKLAALIEQFVALRSTDTVDFVAMDGYRMSYPAAEILDNSNGDWILAFSMDGGYLDRNPGYIRTIKVGPGTPNIDGHLSVKMVERVEVRQKGYRNFELAIEGAVTVGIDRQTVQSCVNCHGVSVQYERRGQAASYRGVALWRVLAYADDPERMPHRVPSSVLSYDAEAARRGYGVDVVAADGFVNSLDSKGLDGNDGIILATLKDGAELAESEWPLVLAWDKGAVVPEAIRPVRQVVKLKLGVGAR